MNSSELINIGIKNARDLFAQTRNQKWLQLAGLYTVCKDLSPVQKGRAVARLIQAETDLMQGKNVSMSLPSIMKGS